MNKFVLNGVHMGAVLALVMSLFLLSLIPNYILIVIFFFLLPILLVFTFSGMALGLIVEFLLFISKKISKSYSLLVFTLFNVCLTAAICLSFTQIKLVEKEHYNDYILIALLLMAMLYFAISNYFIARKELNEEKSLQNALTRFDLKTFKNC
jgi:hypothetical protein